jgi:pullulanase/glycogen debranching enzyme
MAMSSWPDRLLAGTSYPLGATWDGLGTNFAVFSAHATRIELCLFDPSGRRQIARFDLPECTDEVWHGYLHRSPAPAGRHFGRADAGARLRQRPPPDRTGLRNYWGYNTLGFFAPSRATADGNGSGQRVQDAWSRRCTPPASR